MADLVPAVVEHPRPVELPVLRVHRDRLGSLVQQVSHLSTAVSLKHLEGELVLATLGLAGSLLSCPGVLGVCV